MLDRLDSTIVAISSAPGYGALGIVRLSGPDSIKLAEGMIVLDGGEKLSQMKGFTRREGAVMIDKDLDLPASVYLFRAPKSYTRQDMVEIHTAGSPACLELVREACLSRGALAAEPGEFTARAFLSGAMDLTSAEAVAGVIRAQTDTQLRGARRMMDGALTQQIRSTTDELVELVALVEADIDFSEEPIDFISPDVLSQKVGMITSQLQELLRGSLSAERLSVVPQILLLGPPNAGKSTLMNRLSETSRSICAAVAGTTRDILSAPIRLGQREVMLLDTAGLEASEDDIIAQAQTLTRSSSQQVDLVCVVIDLSCPLDKAMIETIQSLDLDRMVVAANKSDLVSEKDRDRQVEELASFKLGQVCTLSAQTGDNVEALKSLLGHALEHVNTTALGESWLISQRNVALMREAVESLVRTMELCKQARQTIDCADLLAFELRDALDRLGAITGEVTTEDLLGKIFANFCIGK